MISGRICAYLGIPVPISPYGYRYMWPYLYMFGQVCLSGHTCAYFAISLHIWQYVCISGQSLCIKPCQCISGDIYVYLAISVDVWLYAYIWEYVCLWPYLYISGCICGYLDIWLEYQCISGHTLVSIRTLQLSYLYISNYFCAYVAISFISCHICVYLCICSHIFHIRVYLYISG